MQFVLQRSCQANWFLDREEAKAEESFELSNDYEDDDDEEWVDPGEWDDADEGEDVKDEGAAYLEFLHGEVMFPPVQLKYLLTPSAGGAVQLGRRR